MKRSDVKSNCPVNFTTEAFGDAWSFLILRDIADTGKKTFGEFLASDERIGRSVLADRLLSLVHRGVIAKQISTTDKRLTYYSLTEDGIKALPLLYEVWAWGVQVSPNPSVSKQWRASLAIDRQTVLQAWEKAVRSGSSFMNGPDSVVEQLGLSSANF
jgi:DNA-binding HxlR family transcriptional regulator